MKRVVIVTGASSGVGRAVALRLAASGWRVALVGRDPARLERTTADMAGTDDDRIVLPRDLGVLENVHLVVDETLRTWKRLDAIVNSAAVAASSPIQATDPKLLSATFKPNTFAPALLVARAWPVFRAQGGGCVVNISSLLGARPLSGMSIYSASKAALESLTRSIHEEGGARGIRAFCIAMGAVETPMLRKLIGSEPAPSDTLTPEHVAEEVEHCIEHRRDLQAGTTIVLRQRH